MKRHGTNSSKQAHRKAAIRHRAAIHRSRPLHKKILLHPFSVMVLLCVGVLIIGLAIKSWAATYDVKATVPAAAVTSPATITSPTDQLHVSTVPIKVTGTCPADSYVSLMRNNSFSGVSACNNGTFQIQTDLTGGANTLKARVFNLTDQEGPASPAITVFYDETTIIPAPPPANNPPMTLRVEDIDDNSYRSGTLSQTSVLPTVTGTAPPFSDVVLTFHSDPKICKTKADGLGWWACTLNTALPAGVHRVDIVALAPDGQRFVFPSFRINARLDLSDLTNFSKPLLINTDYRYQAHRTKQNFSFNLAIGGGVAPYQVRVEWGDGKTTDLVRTDQTNFVITHAYDAQGEYTVMVEITDALGITANLQLLAVTNIPSTAAAATTEGNFLSSLFSGAKSWIWWVGPVYIVVILMVISYWIGEQQVYWRLMAGRRGTPPKGKAR